MGIVRRLGYAISIVVIDFIVFFVPLAAVLLAYVIIFRPPWFRDAVDGVYGERSTGAVKPAA